jgi:hypothetical protein
MTREIRTEFRIKEWKQMWNTLERVWQKQNGETRSAHNDISEHSGHLGYDAVSIGGCFPTFRKKSQCRRLQQWSSSRGPEVCDEGAQWQSFIELERDIRNIKFLYGRPRKVFQHDPIKTARRGEGRCGHSREQRDVRPYSKTVTESGKTCLKNACWIYDWCKRYR